MASITIDKVTKRYGDTLAVSNVSLQIRSGELYFLLGPSGCGKTTLLRMLAGLIESTSGRILFGDRDVTNVPTGQRGTALVFQSYALWPHMTVSENVAFGLEVRNLPREEIRQRVSWALETTRMSDYANRKPAQLSGGQQQRVALSRALAVRPEVLLLDEPLSNLDAKLRLEMRDEIRRICTETSITSVYVTHDQEEALSMADRLAVMNEGRILQVGTPQELYKTPSKRFVAAFLGQANFIDGEVAVVEPNRCVIRTELGLLTVKRNGSDVDVGTKVTCMLRPESIRFVERPELADNAIEARLIYSSFWGPVAQHSVEVCEGLELRVSEMSPQEEVGRGQRLVLGFDASDVVLLGE
jgi:iron(III) transport system ATP-binding protein